MVQSVSIELLTAEYYQQAGSWLSDADINQWLYAEWRARSVDERLVAILAMNDRNRLFLVRTENQPVGLVALGEISGYDRSASLWYLLGVRALGARGVMSSGVALAVDRAFRELGLHSLYASIIEGNAASRRVLEKNGFCEAGRLREAFRLGERFVDRILFDRVNTSLSADGLSR